ncbi:MULTISPECIES: multidrug efflux RND transporter permease subunit [Methylobacterium]|jgi:multidrug efflux pump|uniref:Efflux pump membrane transporter n=1 Tax=Methylobacterium hispanicum TaxID=270350 RepID=A0AAV4ZW07_9HYPH|nr:MULTISPECIES: multidrug efflux RND transporter permease subunit [Methylobacterium]GAN52556.1 RND multidrug efflux transporter MexD [Methylobacterium sp. ME121]MBN6824426.1 multidrug efflux RND transporter permease subunit [Methylobacterium organophilum]MBP31755.1 multidrug efflux RND transporter permease subunit [Methylobacterium sp.]MDH2314131.1 multidrug efflux RND transporter permease subunit [Methylobacterium brachiatum]OXE38675.1 multidrug efflux RND transporter permease subunit [Methy
MPGFFIARPIFAWVVAIFICLGGLLALPFLPVAQYPVIAPPSISISTVYPGASTQNLYFSVTRLIEEELNGAANVLNYESTSDTTGEVEIIVNFQPGTDIALAAVDVQNRIKRIEPRLPEAVREQGILIVEASSAILQFVTLTSSDGSLDEVGLGDVATRNVLPELRRLLGVGRARLFSTERAMRVWLDPDKMLGVNLTAQDVEDAIKAQNAQVASGLLGVQPSPRAQRTQNMVLVKGQLESPEDFGSIVLRANPNGSTVRLRDVARLEVGGLSYAFSTRLNGKPAAAIAVQLAPTGNALATGKAVKAKMEQLARFFPPGLKYEISYDVTPVITASVKKVLLTLAEAVVLVFVVMFLFLQNFRYTLIPTIVVPIALLGTCVSLLLMGFSINVLTMFGMVLAIGILVDDAIVVVENVERIMAEEGLSPRAATEKAMGQITGAVIGITLVLMAVFVPMAFFPGSVGIMYQQFSAAMVVSIGFSAFLALSLTPALCATMLKPIAKGHGHAKEGVFGWFNRSLDWLTRRYGTTTRWMVARSGRFMLLYLALLGGLGYALWRLPAGFVPIDDQGFVMADVLAPSDASANRTLDVVRSVEEQLAGTPGVDKLTFITGFSFFGQGAMTAQAFVTLKDWSERDADQSSAAIIDRSNETFVGLRDAEVSALAPPPIANLGTTSGFSFRLQDRSQRGYEALMAAKDQLLAAASRSPILREVTVEGLPPAPQIRLDIDREKAAALGVTFADINTTLSAQLGSSYVNDFLNRGRMQRVVVQAREDKRVRPEDLLTYSARNSSGAMVPFASFARVTWVVGPTQVIGFNGYPAVRITGSPAQGYTSGDALAEMERLTSELPGGFGYEWTGQSLQEKLAGSQAAFLLGLSILFVFLCLAALYESWSIPFAVMLVVPLGIVGSVAAAYLRGLPNDVYFTVGLITIIGLSAKNAILIIEFAKDLRAQGKPLIAATLEAAELRFRPIVMTSLAFILGVVPLVIASGASAKSQQALGTGVLGGMITATVLAVFMVPIFFVVVMRFLSRGQRTSKPELADAA